VRKLFILIVVSLFCLYCWSSYHSYTWVTLPEYKPVEVDLLGGMDRTKWEKDPTHQATQIMHLSQMRYHAPTGGIRLDDGTVLNSGQALTVDEFRKIIAKRLADNPGNLAKEPLRDPKALLVLAGRKYHLRNPVENVMYKEQPLDRAHVDKGVALDKPLIDALMAAGVKRVSVVGGGDVVSPQIGTMALVILIFLALVMALTDLMWDPLLKIIDERRKEVREGTELARVNRKENLRIEDEGVKLRAEARRKYLERLADAQREALKKADVILGEARDKVHAMRAQAARELTGEMEKAEAELLKQVPELAGAIVAQVMGRAPGKGVR
jgi:F-type H+-transporting ATPase subunit b